MARSPTPTISYKGELMPRHKRVLSNTGTYHVVIKGADRQRMFEESRDYRKYLDLLDYYKQECHFELLAYCLMDNHVHLLIHHSPEVSLETIFRKLNTTYAGWFNMKYERTGFLQNGRYFSVPIDSANSLLSVARYIHFNPTNAGLEQAPGQAYPWSSYHDYKSTKKTRKLTDTATVLSLFEDIKSFKRFHLENPKDTKEKHLDIEYLRKRLPDDVASEIIFEVSNCKTATEFQKLALLQRDCYIKELHKKGLSIRQLNRLTGIPRGIIERLLAK